MQSSGSRLLELFTPDEIYWMQQSVRKELQEMVEFRYMIVREKPNHVLFGGMDRAASRTTIIHSISQCIETLHEILGKLGYDFHDDAPGFT